MSLIDDIIKKNQKEEEERARKRELAQRAPMGPVQPRRLNSVVQTSSGISVKSSPFDYSQPTVTVARNVPQPSLRVVGANGTPAPTPPRNTPTIFRVGEGLSAADQERAQAAIELATKNARETEELRKKIKPSVAIDNFTKQAIPATLRAAPRAAISIKSSINSKSLANDPSMGKIKTPYGDEYIAQSPAAKFVFGTEPIGTIKQEGEKLTDLASAGGIKYAEWKDNTTLSEEDKTAIFENAKKYKWLTVPLGLLAVGTDLIPGVGGTKKAVSKEVAEQLVKKYGLETANEIIEKGGKELAEQAMKKESKEFLTEFTDPLTTEARKYKSAEEFVKAQGTPVYRGEGGSNVAQGKALLAEGKHFASDSKYPQGFGKVSENIIKPNVKVLDLGDSTFAEISKKLGIPERRYISPKELSTLAKEKGYDVLKYNGEYKSTGKQFTHFVDLTGDSTITKSQLEEIWKKANKNVEIEPLIQEAKKYKSAEEFVKNPRYEYHLSTEANLAEGKTFAEQATKAGSRNRGFANSAEEGIYSTNSPQFWSQQLQSDLGKKAPQHLYLVEVKNPSPRGMLESGFDAQAINAAQDVRIIKKLGTTKDLSDMGRIEQLKKSQLTDIWNKANQSAKPVPYPDNIKVANNYPKQEPGTVRLYNTRGKAGDVHVGDYLDTNIDEHLARGSGSEIKQVFDIPEAEYIKLLKSSTPEREAVGIKIVNDAGINKYRVFDSAIAPRLTAGNTPALPETVVSRRGVTTSAQGSATRGTDLSLSSKQVSDGPKPSPEAIRQSSGDYSLDKIVKDNDPILTQTRQSVKDLTTENRAALARSAKLVPGEINPANVPLYTRFRGAVGEAVQKLRETVEDSRIRLKNLQRTQGVVLPDDIDPYNAYKLFVGRVSERIDDVTLKIKNIDKQIVKASKKSGIDDKLISEDVNDYLIARHAPERNKELGDAMAAGITDEQAAKITSRIEAQPNFKEIKKAADEIADVNKQTLEVLRDGGVISPAQYKKLTTAYKNHVPLQRIFEDDEDFARILTSRNMDVKQTGLIRAKGSTRDIADIMQNVADNAKAAIVRAEKNKADLELLAFARANKDTGLFTEIPYNKARKGDESILFFFENGKHKALKINDPLLASAIKGTNMQHLPQILKFVHTFTRLMSSLATRYNPEFLLPNKIRDIQELMVFTAAQKDMGFKTAGKAVLKDPGSIKDIYSYMRGIDTPGARLYKQMRLDGGSTGGLALSTKKASELDMAKLKKLNRSKPRQALEATFAGIDHANQIIEDSTRLSVYKTALEKGLSRKQAAVLAKDATIDFNKMGTGGPIINALYMFSNASIQGSAKTLRSMKNPKVAATVLLTVGATTTLVNQYNDNIDEDWRSKVPEWDRFNNLVVLVPSNDGVKYVKLPVSWGLKPFKVASDYMYDLSTRDDMTIGKALEGTVAATIDAYNPLGGTNLMSTVTPTLLDVPMDIRGNRAWHGGKIKPDYDPNSPEALKYYKSLLTTPSGRRFEDITSWLYKKSDGKVDISPADLDYAFKQYIGGTGRFASRSITTINSIGKGEAPPANEIPLTNRFYGSKSEEEVGDELMPKSELYKVKASVSAKEKFRQKDAEKLYEKLTTISDPEKRATLVRDEIQKGNITPEDLVKVIEKKTTGLSEVETVFKSSSIAARAEYLKKILPNMNAEERQALIKQLSSKELLTPDLIREFIRISQ